MISGLPIFFCCLLAVGQVVAIQKPQIPGETGSLTLQQPQLITGTFNGGFKKYGRGVECTTVEMGESAAVFIVEDGGTIEDVIIGPDQIEGIHCRGSCTLKNVWWKAVCDDALTILQGAGGITRVTGGGAFNSKNKIFQHDGLGELHIENFYVSDYVTFYASCGNCPNNKGPRKVFIDGVYAEHGEQYNSIVAINSNMGDQATIKNTCGSPVAHMCTKYQGCSKPCSSKYIGAGFDNKSCIDGGGNTDTCDSTGSSTGSSSTSNTLGSTDKTTKISHRSQPRSLTLHQLYNNNPDN